MTIKHPLDRMFLLLKGSRLANEAHHPPSEVQMLTPQMSAEQMKLLNQQLRDALVLILADYLVEDVPLKTTSLLGQNVR